jgi:hypothetical protein
MQTVAPEASERRQCRGPQLALLSLPLAFLAGVALAPLTGWSARFGSVAVGAHVRRGEQSEYRHGLTVSRVGGDHLVVLRAGDWHWGVVYWQQ